MENRLGNIVIIRVFAILTVVLGHSMIIFSDSWNYYQLSSSSHFFNFLKIIINIYQMPIFFFVSGFLFYYLKVDLGKYDNKNIFFKNKLRRLVIPYCVVSVCYMIPLRILGEYPNYMNKNVGEIIVKDIILGKDSGNLWFLPVLFLIFIFFRFIFFSDILSSIRNKYYLWMVIFIVYANISVIMPNILFIKNFLQYLIYFFLGYSFKKIVSPHKYFFSNKGMVVLLVASSMSFFFQIYGGKSNSSYMTGLQFNIGMMSSVACCILIYAVSDMIQKKKKSIVTNPLLNRIDRDSFGIYLFHSPLLYPVLNQINGKNINPYILVPLLFIFIFLTSWGITVLLSKSKYTSFIIGK